MTREQKLRVCLLQWKDAADLLRGPLDTGAHEKIVAYMLGRDVLAEVPEMQAALAEPDADFAAALAAASPAWAERLDRIADRSEIAGTAWWENLLEMARRQPVAL